MSEITYETFGKFRAFIWPIHRSELKKLLPMLLLCFITATAYNILRNMKDSLIITSAASGSEVVPFLKVWVMLPVAVIFSSIFIKLSHRYSSQRVYYILVSSFLAFFLLFTFIAYPMRDTLHPHGLAETLRGALPSGFGGMIGMIRFWTFSLFYAMAENWGVICLTILFWGFANEITSVMEATRFYGILAIGANCGSMVAGRISHFLSTRPYNPNWIIGEDRWHQSLILLTLAVVGMGLVMMLIFRWFNRNVVKSLDLPTGHHNTQLDKLEARPSMRESFRHLIKSKYLIRIAIVVVSYNLFMNLVEVVWKGQVKQLYPDPSAYNTYMSNITSLTGLIATLMGLFLSGNMLRRFGWTATAMLTPAILLITSIGFFAFYFMPDNAFLSFTAISPLAIAVFFGSTQNCFSRAAKYSIFDETMEMTFIPLDKKSRVQGKAAIDGVTSRAGKSTGSVIYQVLFMVLGGLSASVPVVTAMLVAILFVWMSALRKLGRSFGEASEAKAATAA